METGEVKKYYQWKGGWRRGQVECYLAETEDTIFFEGGNTVSKSKLDEELVTISEEMYMASSQSAQSQSETMKAWESMLGNEPTPSQSENPKSVIITELPKEKSPIQIILERQKKKDKKDFSIIFQVELPSEKVLDLLTTMFDEEEVYDEIINSAISSITLADYQNILKQHIISTIKGTENEDDK